MNNNMPYYLNPVRVGLDAVASLGDGYSINIKWFQSYPTIKTNKIAYHIYFSIIKENVFLEGIKYVSIDGLLETNIIDLIPGQEYFFSVRPVEYNPNLFNLALLPIAYDNLRIYPSSILVQDISSTDLIIPLLDITDFPNTGIIKVGVELIQYSSIDFINSKLLLTDISQRGYNTTAKIHTISGFDGYVTWDPTVVLFTEGESNQFDRIFACQCRFEYPNYPFTIIDGYNQVTKDLLSTDLSASDIDNVNFPMYDFAGYHRTDPVQLLNGTCIGSYIGGEMGCIDGYGNYNILRGFNLQDHNNQRQEVDLSVTGRPAVLIKRVQTGITCACYLASSEYPDDRCPLCFAEGTLINTKSGFRPIEDIKIGDEVLSSDGEFHKVLNTFKHEYKGELRSISTVTTTSPILCTPDHSFLALGGFHNNSKGCGPNYNCKEFIKRGDGKRSNNVIKLLSNGKWQARIQIKSQESKILGTFDTKENAQIVINNYQKNHQCFGHHIIGKEAKDLNKKDWLVNANYRYIHDLEKINIPDVFLSNKRQGDISFIVNDEFLWIIGLYLTKGSSNKNDINFSLHKNEIEYQNKIISYFNKHNYTTNIKKNSNNRIVVNVFGSSLAEWFTNWLGHEYQGKKIPQELMYLSDNKSKYLLQGIFDGGGHKKDAELIQTSEIFALQVIEILHRLGDQPNVKRITNKILNYEKKQRKVVYKVSRKKNIFSHKNRKGRWQFNDKLLSIIKNNDIINYNGMVYNLEVEGEHNYIVQNISVENCYGTKFVFGYEQYFNPRRSDGRIMVRPGPTDENTKMYEAGLESEFPLNLWTLTVPTIKTRDIIILFDLDGNEEFRYEVISVTRNNTILSQQGGQLFKVMRVRKFDPAYQIRVFRDTSMFPSKLSTSIGMVIPGIPPHTHEITKNELDSSNWSQTTSISQGHNHPVLVKNGQLTVMEVLGHSHNIL